MNHRLLVFAIFLLSNSVLAQGPAFVKIQAQLSEPLAERQALYIRGSHKMMGQWEHGKVRLARKQKVIWSGFFMVNEGDQLEFILDGGSPQKIFPTMDTISFKVNGDTSVEISIDEPLDTIGIIYPQGTIHNLPASLPDKLRDRMVYVRTPPGYEGDTARSFPVLFLMDAQSLFTPEGSPDGFCWHIDKTMDSLEYHGLIEPTILVAIEHVWGTRSMEYSDTDLGMLYRGFLTKDLAPRIARQFRVKKAPSEWVIGGAVAGGFVSLLTAWESPETFGNVLALSPAVEVQDNDFLSIAQAYEGEPKSIRVYMDRGEFGLDEQLKSGILKLKEYFESEGYPLEYNFEPNTIPDGENMARRVIPGLFYFFGSDDN